MKAILEFNLPEEASDHYYAVNGSKYSFVLSDLDNWLRNIIKHNPDSYSEKEISVFEKTRAEIFSLMEKWSVTYEP